MIEKAVSQLMSYGSAHHLFDPQDAPYVLNRVLEVLHSDGMELKPEPEAALTDILDELTDYAVEKGLSGPSAEARDLFDTKIMGCLLPMPSDVTRQFKELEKESPEKATDWYYALSQDSNYIRADRIARNIVFSKPTEYGDMQITINLSKPEKDPRDIAAAKNRPSSGYPKCLLCRENEGYAGHIGHPARQNHRIIPLDLPGGRYFMQYSPYVYYNEHCIILNEEHIPMRVDHGTFENLFGFVERFPHYMLGSNTDIPIVGGSILTHDHYQGGHHHFPMQDAVSFYDLDLEDGVHAELLNWPLSTIRISGTDKEQLIGWADRILEAWKQYENPELDIIAWEGDTRHNAITPIVRQKDGVWQMDLVLRNNRTSEEFPLGIFHPHPEHHHIKKENIGLIEVMGLAVLPARLKDELALIQDVLAGNTTVEEHPELEKHAVWIEELKEQLPQADLDDFVRQAVADKFAKVLENAGVFKLDDTGKAAFTDFAKSLKK